MKRKHITMIALAVATQRANAAEYLVCRGSFLTQDFLEVGQRVDYAKITPFSREAALFAEAGQPNRLMSYDIRYKKGALSLQFNAQGQQSLRVTGYQKLDAFLEPDGHSELMKGFRDSSGREAAIEIPYKADVAVRTAAGEKVMMFAETARLRCHIQEASPPAADRLGDWLFWVSQFAK